MDRLLPPTSQSEISPQLPAEPALSPLSLYHGQGGFSPTPAPASPSGLPSMQLMSPASEGNPSLLWRVSGRCSEAPGVLQSALSHPWPQTARVSLTGPCPQLTLTRLPTTVSSGRRRPAPGSLQVTTFSVPFQESTGRPGLFPPQALSLLHGSTAHPSPARPGAGPGKMPGAAGPHRSLRAPPHWPPGLCTPLWLPPPPPHLHLHLH